MESLLIAVIYLIFISLGLPDSLLGSGWPKMQMIFEVPSSYAGYVSMTISFMTIISALLSPKLMKFFHTKWIIITSIILTIAGLIGFSICNSYWMLFVFAIPYGFGAGAIDSAVNHYVANNYTGAVMNFLHCFYGVGAVISPYIMSLALKHARWNEGYRWTAFVQTGILLIVIFSLPLWKKHEAKSDEKVENAGIKDTIKLSGLVQTLISFWAYCSGEACCFLWIPSYFAATKNNLSDEKIASFGSLIFAGLMIGRFISGFISDKLGDKKLIRYGIMLELAGIALVMIPSANYWIAVVGFVIVGIGMGPVYPAIMHMAPFNFGKKYSSAVIALQMAAAYVGSTFTPMLFGQLQRIIGIGIMPVFLAVFAIINIFMIELAYVKADKKILN